MNLELRFTITDRADVQQARVALDALETMFVPPVEASVPQKRAKRSCVKKANGVTEPAPEPVAEAPEPVMTTPELEPVAPAESDDELRERFRLIAVERGVLWLRPLLKERGVEKLSALAIDQVRELISVAAE